MLMHFPVSAHLHNNKPGHLFPSIIVKAPDSLILVSSFFVRILGHIKVHGSRATHRCRKDEKGDQQKSKVHHRCHIHTGRKFFGFLYARSFFVATIATTVSILAILICFND